VEKFHFTDIETKKKKFFTRKFAANNKKIQNPRTAKVSLLPTPTEITDYY